VAGLMSERKELRAIAGKVTQASVARAKLSELKAEAKVVPAKTG